MLRGGATGVLYCRWGGTGVPAAGQHHPCAHGRRRPDPGRSGLSLHNRRCAVMGQRPDCAVPREWWCDGSGRGAARRLAEQHGAQHHPSPSPGGRRRPFAWSKGHLQPVPQREEPLNSKDKLARGRAAIRHPLNWIRHEISHSFFPSSKDVTPGARRVYGARGAQRKPACRARQRLVPVSCGGCGSGAGSRP